MWNDIFFCFPFWVEEAYVWSVESADQMNPGTHVSFLNKVLGKSSKSRHTLENKCSTFFPCSLHWSGSGPGPMALFSWIRYFSFSMKKKKLFLLIFVFNLWNWTRFEPKDNPKKGEIWKPQGTIFGRPRIRIRLHQNDRTVWRLFTL